MPSGDGKKLVGLVLVFQHVAGIRHRRGGCSPAKNKRPCSDKF